MQPFYLVRHHATGTIYRVAADLQSKNESPDGGTVFIDQQLLKKVGAQEQAVLEIPGLDPWLDSIPTT